MKDWSKEIVLIIGAARQGTALARYVLEHNGQVILTDLLPPSELEAARQALEPFSMKGKLEWVLGEHPLSMLEEATLICPSGGVPLKIPILQEARQRGIPFSNDSQIFLETVPCLSIGITGSAGKSTTTMLLGRILKAAADHSQAAIKPQIWIGGNIGSPLIAHVDEMKPEDIAVIELSSFQLEIMTRSPNVAVVLNITPNHLDRHTNFEDYFRSKSNILAYQSDQDISILGRDDPVAWSLKKQVKGRCLSFGFSELLDEEEGAFLNDGWIFVRTKDPIQDQVVERRVIPVKSIVLRGDHNLQNVMASCAAAAAVGVPEDSMKLGVEGFKGAPHRLEFVRHWRGADWYNDSIATAPERAIASIRSFDEPMIVLAGGRDKDLPWDKFVEFARERVSHLIVFGEAAGLIQRAFDSESTSKPVLICCKGLRDAVLQAAQIVQPGYVVLLAPGGTSFDEFKDFEERGECFAQWVRELT